REGYRFQKPEGWATYDWEAIRALSIAPDSGFAVGAGLRTKPEFYYLNERQDMLVAFYRDNIREESLMGLFGQESLTDLEKEITRDLPSDRSKETKFEFPKDSGYDWTENVYSGRMPSG